VKALKGNKALTTKPLPFFIHNQTLDVKDTAPLPLAPNASQVHKYCLIYHNRFTARFRDHPGEPLPEENFWTLWCKGRLTKADTLTMQLGATSSRLTSAHLHHPPIFFTGRMPYLLPNQQRQSTEGN